MRNTLDYLHGRSIAVTIADPSQRDCPLIFSNAAFEVMTGYEQADVLGQNCRFMQHEHTDRTSVATLHDAIDAREPVTQCLLNRRADGTLFHNFLIIRPITIENRDLLVGCQFRFALDTERVAFVEQTKAVYGMLTERDAITDRTNRLIRASMNTKSEVIFALLDRYRGGALNI